MTLYAVLAILIIGLLACALVGFTSPRTLRDSGVRLGQGRE
jgi:hypothetical protein